MLAACAVAGFITPSLAAGSADVPLLATIEARPSLPAMLTGATAVVPATPGEAIAVPPFQ